MYPVDHCARRMTVTYTLARYLPDHLGFISFFLPDHPQGMLLDIDLRVVTRRRIL